MSDLPEKVYIETDYMTLSQLLKYAGIIGTGGQAKWFLSEYIVYVDGELEERRGRKLYPGQRIDIPDEGSYLIVSQDDAHEA